MSRAYQDVQAKLDTELADAKTVGGAVEAAASLYGDDRYMTYAPTGDHLTFRELNAQANRRANALSAIGVEQGDRVGLYLENTPDFVVSVFACAKLGAIETPINWKYRAREVRHAIDSAEISTILAQPGDDIVDTLATVAPDAAPLDRVLMTGNRRVDDITELNDIETHLLSNLEADASDTNPDGDVDSEDPLAILYTSGTTGLPKPAVLSNNSYLVAAKSFLGAPLSRDGANYNPFPLFHANNQVYSMLGSLLFGSRYVLSDAFSASDFWDDVCNHDVTSFNIIGGVPKILDSTIGSDEIPDNDLELAIGPISKELWRHFEEKFDVQVIQIYSQTESPTLLMNHPDSEQIRVGAIGKPMFPDLGHEAAVVDDDGTELPSGESGELVRTDPGAMDGYWNLPDKTNETIRDGKTYSGDIVRMDGDGYFYYVDRKKFMIRRGGENISAQEVENVVDELTDVEESALIPVPDEFRGEEVKALVKRRRNDITPEDIVLHVGRELAAYKIPRYIEFVDAFPRTPTERIRRVQLASEEKEKNDHGWDREREMADWESRL